jgi:hypothetical protein
MRSRYVDEVRLRPKDEIVAPVDRAKNEDRHLTAGDRFGRTVPGGRTPGRYGQASKKFNIGIEGVGGRNVLELNRRGVAGRAGSYPAYLVLMQRSACINYPEVS